MALSQHSKNLAKQALNKDNFTNEHLIEAYGVNQDQLLQLIEQKTPQELYDATYSMYLNAYGDEATAQNYADYIKNFANALQEQSKLDNTALEVKKQADAGEAERRKKEFSKLPKIEKPKPVENQAVVEADLSPNLLREYGNNLFELITYDPSVNNGKDGGRIKLAGVLKQLPSFSMGSTWEAGPAASLSDIIKGYMCSDMMEKIMAIGGSDRAWTTVDEGSDRTYKECTVPSFNLEFRLYPGQAIGTTELTSYDTWITALSLFAQPSIASKININAIGNNLVNGALQGLDNLKTVGTNILGTIAGGDASKNEQADSNMLTDLGNAVGKIVDDAAVLVTSRDDKNRVEGSCNKKNFYGGKLWKLRILPGLIQKPIIVYIAGWSVTYSKEINFQTGKPIYVDFTINCNLDQVPDAGLWMYYMDKNASEDGVFTAYEKTGCEPKQPAKELTEDVVETQQSTFDNGTTQTITTTKHKDGTTDNFVAYTKADGTKNIVHMGTAKPGEEYTKQGMETHSVPPGYHWEKKMFAEVWYLEENFFH